MAKKKEDFSDTSLEETNVKDTDISKKEPKTNKGSKPSDVNSKSNSTKKDQYEVSKVSGSSTVLKQDAAARAVNPSGYLGASEGMGINAAGRSVSGSPTTSVLGGLGATPGATDYRSASRFGKKMDKLASGLAYTPSEQIEREYLEVKPLSENPSSVQGYNGTFKATDIRKTKKGGNVPSEIDFDRSLDYIEKDMIYFSQGQQIPLNSEKHYPTTQAILQSNGVYDYVVDPATRRYAENFKIREGNFIHRRLNFKYGVGPMLDYFYYDVDDVTPNAVSDSTCPGLRNQVCSNYITDINEAELIREDMDAKAGNEAAPGWSPLPRAIPQPDKVIALVRDIEVSMGSELYLNYLKAKTAHSFQLNRAKKDGQDIQRPGVHSCLGSVHTYSSSEQIPDDVNDMISNHVDNNIGNPSAIIAAFDSPNKYHNKADILLQPRSLRMHFKTADSNMGPFKLDPRLVKAVRENETFSTLAADYDPSLPILMTDKARLAHKLNFNDFGSFITSGMILDIPELSSDDVRDGADLITTLIAPGVRNASGVLPYLHYAVINGRDALTLGVTQDGTGVHFYNNSTINGNSRTLIVTAISYSTNRIFDNEETPVQIPANTAATFAGAHSVEYLNTLSTADQAIVTAVTNSVSNTQLVFPTQKTKVLLGAGSYTYVYKDDRNRYITDVKHPLVSGFIRMLEEDFNLSFASTNVFGKLPVRMPCYSSAKFHTLYSYLLMIASPRIVTERIDSFRDVLDYEANHGVIFKNLISLSEAIKSGYKNFSFTDIDSPLQTGTMGMMAEIKWRMPELFWYAVNNDDDLPVVVMPWYMSEGELNPDGSRDGDVASMLWPSIRSGCSWDKLDLFRNNSDETIRRNLDRIVDMGYNSLTRQPLLVFKYSRSAEGSPAIVMDNVSNLSDLYYIRLPRDLGWAMDAPAGYCTAPIYAAAGRSAVGTSSHRVIQYIPTEHTCHLVDDVNDGILGVSAINQRRGFNYTQQWRMFDNISDVDGTIYGLNVAHADSFDEDGVPYIGRASFKPFAGLDTVTDGFTRPDGCFIINESPFYWTTIQKLPFTINPFEISGTSGAHPSNYDIYTLNYVFGLCGFRNSDYSEDVYDRAKYISNEGRFFTSDPWYEKSGYKG